jgi:glycosyltransferase involved in cell wall biosynthesis
MNPTVSLCMIVQDDAELLPRFFAAATGLWDELIVVDTGSTDATVAISGAAGARVLAHPWSDSLSDARNVGVDAATGDWILFLDANEIAPPELLPALRAVVADDRIGAATLRLRNDSPDGNSQASALIRLFRRDDTIRFHHRIHQDVAAPVAAYLKRTKRLLTALPIEVLQLGYGRERAVARRKKERDLRLLEASVAEDQVDYFSWFKMLELCRLWDDETLAHSKARACLIELARSGPGSLQMAPYGGDLIAIAVTAYAGEDLKTAARLMDLWAPGLRPSAAFHLRRGEIAEQLGEAVQARKAFQRCLHIRDASGDPQLTSVRPLMGLARLALATGDLTDAASLTQEALGFNPSNPEALAASSAIAQARLQQSLVERVGGRAVKYDDDTPVGRAIC